MLQYQPRPCSSADRASVSYTVRRRFESSQGRQLKFVRTRERFSLAGSFVLTIGPRSRSCEIMHGYGLDSLSEPSFKKCSGVPLIAPSLWACGTRFGRFSIRIRQVRRRLSPCFGLERESSVENGRCEFCRGLREVAVRDLALKRPRKWPRGGSYR